MKQKVSGPLAGLVIAVFAIAIIGGLYYKFLYERPRTAQESAASMAEGWKKMQEYMKTHNMKGGPPGSQPAAAH